MDGSEVIGVIDRVLDLASENREQADELQDMREAELDREMRRLRKQNAWLTDDRNYWKQLQGLTLRIGAKIKAERDNANGLLADLDSELKRLLAKIAKLEAAAEKSKKKPVVKKAAKPARSTLRNPPTKDERVVALGILDKFANPAPKKK